MRGVLVFSKSTSVPPTNRLLPTSKQIPSSEQKKIVENLTYVFERPENPQ